MWEDPNRHKIQQSIAYHLLYGVWWALSHLPLCVLYAVSDVLFVLVYYVLRYRRHVVRQNLDVAFAEKSEGERRGIERRFYRHFCDIFIETLKHFTISHSSIRRRMEFRGVELLRESYESGRACGVYLGHYANWEWISSLPLWVDTDRCQCVQFYRRLDNKVLNRLEERMRSRWGSVNVPANESIRYMARYRTAKRPFIIGFIADQTPWWGDIHYWTSFLGHAETPVFTGAERIMRKFDMDVFYLDVRRVRRGYYIAEYKRITRTPREHPEYWITEQYTRMMEHTILRAPEFWLWSHNRWKRTRGEWEEFKKRQGTS